MGRMLIITMIYTVSVNDPSVSNEIIDMDIQIVAAAHFTESQNHRITE